MINNNIPKEYKESPLGVIPQDWEVRRLGEIAHLTSGATPLRSNNLYFDGGLIPWIKTTDLNNATLNESEECVTNKALDETSIKILPKDTVLVAMYGGFNQIGRTALLGIDSTINQALCALLLDKSIALPKYVLYWLNAKVALWRNFAASSRKDPNITSKDVSHFPIVIPPLVEQERIAEVLGTWDEAIDKQSQLVKALERRKRALMQQLLTARKRLPNFSAPWQTVKLGDILKESKEIERSPNPYNRITVKLNLNGIVKREVKREECVDATVQYKRHVGQFVYGKQNLHKGAFGIIPSELDGCESSQDIPSFDFRGNVDPIFFLNYLGRNSIYEALENISTGTGSKRIQPKDLFKVMYKFPPIEEQEAIAQILTTADKEIELATTKLNSLSTQKRTLMQQLLTGKKRLKI